MLNKAPAKSLSQCYLCQHPALSAKRREGYSPVSSSPPPEALTFSSSTHVNISADATKPTYFLLDLVSPHSIVLSLIHVVLPNLLLFIFSLLESTKARNTIVFLVPPNCSQKYLEVVGLKTVRSFYE